MLFFKKHKKGGQDIEETDEETHCFRCSSFSCYSRLAHQRQRRKEAIFGKKVSVKAGKTKKVTVKGVKTKQIKKTTWSVKSKKVVTLSKKKEKTA